MPLPSTAKIYIAGDSRSVNTTLWTPWPNILNTISSFVAAPVAAGNVFNYAHSGQTTDNILNQFADGMYPANPDNPTIFFCWAAINDLLQNTGTPDSIYTNLKLIWQFARNQSYKVVAFLTGTADHPVSALVPQIDRLILSDQTLYDLLIRPDSIIPIWPANDTSHLWYYDYIHPNTSSTQRIAQYISDALGS